MVRVRQTGILYDDAECTALLDGRSNALLDRPAQHDRDLQLVMVMSSLTRARVIGGRTQRKDGAHFRAHDGPPNTPRWCRE